MAGTSAILFIPDDTGRTGLPRPLMLTQVMGSSLLSWLCGALYRAGTRRVLLVCQDQWAAQALSACPGTLLADAASPGSNAPDSLTGFLAAAEPWEEVITVLTGPVVFDRWTAFCATSEPEQAPGPGCGVWDVAIEALRDALTQAGEDENEEFDFVAFLRQAGVSYTSRDGLFAAGSREDLLNWRTVLRRARVRELEDQGAEIWDPDSIWAGPEVTAAQGAVLLPNVILRGSTSLGPDCVIGPNAMLCNAAIGQGAVVNASQVIDSTLGPNASVGPYVCLQAGTILEQRASVGPFSQLSGSALGQEARLEGLDFLTGAEIGSAARLDHGVLAASAEGTPAALRVGSGAFVGAGTTLRAPVELGDESIVTPGSAITEPVPDHAAASAAARQTNHKRKTR